MKAKRRSPLAALIVLVTLCMFAGIRPVSAQTGQGVVYWTDGSSYEAFLVPGGITWSAAEANAVALGGHLASIHSQAQDDFVFNLIDSQAFWQPNVPGQGTYEYGPWIGGELEGGAWDWSDGSTFQYSNWAPGQPDDYDGVEDAIQFYGFTISDTWNDENGNYSYPSSNPIPENVGYVVEWAPAAVPEPGTWALIGIGIPLFLRMRRRWSN